MPDSIAMIIDGATELLCAAHARLRRDHSILTQDELLTAMSQSSLALGFALGALHRVNELQTPYETLLLHIQRRIELLEACEPLDERAEMMKFHRLDEMKHALEVMHGSAARG